MFKTTFSPKRLLASGTVLACLAFSMQSQALSAQILVEYQFSGTNNSNSLPSLNPIISEELEGQVTASAVSRGTPFPGATVSNTGARSSRDGSYFFRVTTSGDEDATRLLGSDADYAINNGTYIEFTVEPQNGLSLNLTRLTSAFGGEIVTGGAAAFDTHVFVRSSLDNYEEDLFSGSVTRQASSGSSWTGWQDIDIDLSADFSGLDEAVTFRIYAYAVTDEATYPQLVRIGNIQVEGAVIPEPRTVALGMGLVTLLIVTLRHTKRNRA